MLERTFTFHQLISDNILLFYRYDRSLADLEANEIRSVRFDSIKLSSVTSPAGDVDVSVGGAHL